ncbi:MAG: antibiotic biosynthesis monooxygenase [Syntrophales bacterium]|nr:antibiotic biosynthesis monooxygenase [Syntrophales bacterium]
MIRVLIERHCLTGKEDELRHLIQEVRSDAVHRRGYISGETLRAADNPLHFMIISTWTTIEAWKAWESDRRKVLIHGMMDSLLSEPEVVRIFIEEPSV